MMLALASSIAASGFYLPGVAPREYQTGERVELKVNKLTSTKTQVSRPLACLTDSQVGRAIGAGAGGSGEGAWRGDSQAVQALVSRAPVEHLPTGVDVACVTCPMVSSPTYPPCCVSHQQQALSGTIMPEDFRWVGWDFQNGGSHRLRNVGGIHTTATIYQEGVVWRILTHPRLVGCAAPLRVLCPPVLPPG